MVGKKFKIGNVCSCTAKRARFSPSTSTENGRKEGQSEAHAGKWMKQVVLGEPIYFSVGPSLFGVYCTEGNSYTITGVFPWLGPFPTHD